VPKTKAVKKMEADFRVLRGGLAAIHRQKESFLSQCKVGGYYAHLKVSEIELWVSAADEVITRLVNEFLEYPQYLRKTAFNRWAGMENFDLDYYTNCVNKDQCERTELGNKCPTCESDL